MTCDAVRAALSALLDGETVDRRTFGGGPAEVEAHLLVCPACQDWRARAERVTRAVREQLAEVPDLTARVLAAVAADRRAAAWERRQVLRFAVALFALGQAVLALQPILGMDSGSHISREMASFELAVAVGFGLAAYRPQRARVFVPVAVVLAGCLAVTSMADIASGRTALVQEVVHLAAVVQPGLLWALARAHDAGPDAPGVTAVDPTARA
jgi:predicted anti-sigma-YlaC factor YlaD